jgi:HAD superfamily hydrolase (TIGR01509 family)
MKISAVCFDLGNVLISVHWERMLDKLVEKSSLPREKIAEFLDHQNSRAYELGTLTSRNYFSAFKKAIKYKGTNQELQAAFSEIFTPMTENIALAAMLRPHYPLAIISNTNDAHILHAEEKYTFFSLFNARIYSHQVKLAKPGPEIYHAALKALGGIDPLEALFIDDLEPNILGASKLGWQTIHLRPEVNLHQALSSYDLKGLD